MLDCGRHCLCIQCFRLPLGIGCHNGIEWRPGDNLVTRVRTSSWEQHSICRRTRRVRRASNFESSPGRKILRIRHDSRIPACRCQRGELFFERIHALYASSAGPFLRERGVILFVDGTQSVGALEFDVQKLQPDVLAVHGYSWLISPTGAGFVYVAPHLRPHHSAWGGQPGAATIRGARSITFTTASRCSSRPPENMRAAAFPFRCFMRWRLRWTYCLSCDLP